jgi:beta-glucosidase
VSLSIPVKSLAYYDVKTNKWVVEPGTYKLLAGTSSRDIKETATITVN